VVAVGWYGYGEALWLELLDFRTIIIIIIIIIVVAVTDNAFNGLF
jgi:hypothetical protein